MLNKNSSDELVGIEKLPDHVLIEIFTRAGVSEWAQISCVKKQWASLFRCECFWQAALANNYPFADPSKTWPGPIPPPALPKSGILHGTMIDQFIACGNSRDVAHELASRIWLAVLDNLEENQHTFCLLKRLAQEGDQVFLPYPYTRSVKVQWRVFEKLFTDFRDCFNHVDYYDMLACAKSRFQPIPSAWLGY
ncbi:uncharacterized protein LOC133300416 isoform X3 [Gastrolobium bilobum]|uniref:uncharacterized protein LOC133300416 isoform X3 n=1 Tax=Gastrolobium bilobum TaxID=150636 RepID=UPI002AB2BAE8|nr:uncharacterized protein LOC133300416 isoform X3 [Gastrolobium bilobum]